MRLNKDKKTYLKQIGPWIGAFVILFYFFISIDINYFILSLKNVKVEIYLPLVIFFIFLWFFYESQNLFSLFRSFDYSISYKDMLFARGITYILMIINYHLGLGAIAVLIKKKHSIPINLTSGILFFYLVVDTLTLIILVLLGCFFLNNMSVQVKTICYMSLGILSMATAGIILLKTAWFEKTLLKYRRLEFLKILRNAPVKNYFILFLFRVGYFTSFVCFFFFAVKAFGMNIPFFSLSVYVPLIFFAGNLPVTPFGLGTIQGAMLYFFKDYGSDANILAFGMVYSTSLLILRLPIGFFYLKQMR